MKTAFALALLAAFTRPSTSLAVRRGNSTSWMGTNLYYLQGLSDSDQDAYISQMAEDGAKVVRVWANAQTVGCQKGSRIAITVPPLESTIGQYNDETLDALDKVIVKLSGHGIKALISPHDANSLLGDYRKDIYYDTWGAQSFYESQEAFEAYDARLTHILNYKGATSGRVWKDWREAIMGFNLQARIFRPTHSLQSGSLSWLNYLTQLAQNEPMSPTGSHCTGGDTHGWICGRATHMREQLGQDNPIIVTSGGIGGDFSHGCTFVEAATSCPALDAIAVHRYASVPGNWAASAGGWVKQAGGKLVYLEEWGIDAAKYDRSATFPSEAADMNSVGLPSLYWQIILPDVEGCEYDPATDSGDKFGIVYGSGVDFAGPMQQAAQSTSLQDWAGIV
ncbi:hypothetical protein Daus18300_004231 [Diaporthe australafricana]|uniref:Glycoside hydrolase family 5 domain-containing protein n=1 Tax=Diaporthe australafricana TaxID=127596 RepID=A0ABR3XAJ9_9PEZI